MADTSRAWLKQAERSIKECMEFYENASEFYSTNYARAATVEALKAYLAERGVDFPTERPYTNSVRTLLDLAHLLDSTFEDYVEAIRLDFWPMPPTHPGEAVPAIVQFLQGSPEAAEQALEYASQVMNKVRWELQAAS